MNSGAFLLPQTGTRNKKLKISMPPTRQYHCIYVHRIAFLMLRVHAKYKLYTCYHWWEKSGWWKHSLISIHPAWNVLMYKNIIIWLQYISNIEEKHSKSLEKDTIPYKIHTFLTFSLSNFKQSWFSFWCPSIISIFSL